MVMSTHYGHLGRMVGKMLPTKAPYSNDPGPGARARLVPHIRLTSAYGSVVAKVIGPP